MKVGIDISSLIYGRGVSRYTSNLIRALLRQPSVELSLYGSSFRRQAELKKMVSRLIKETTVNHLHRQPTVVIQSYPPSLQHFLWNWLHRNRMQQILPQLDVFHSWDWLVPPDRQLPLVSTIHDLAILKYPETAHPKILKMHRQSWQRLKQTEAEIIAVSQATKQDIVQLLKIPASKVHVIYEALPVEVIQTAEALTETRAEDIKRRLRLDKPYLLFVGTREPRKNLARLIQAWQPLATEVELLIAGDTGWDEVEKQTVPQAGLRFLGRVSDPELAVLYGEAEALVYPSLYEGFGLPILEAFYHGTPVVTSNVSALPEVAGNAAELVDPESVSSIRSGIEKVLHESTAEQQKRLQRMIIRLHLFDWQRVAEETIKVYQLAAEGKK